MTFDARAQARLVFALLGSTSAVLFGVAASAAGIF